MTKSLEQIPQNILRIGLAAESAFHSRTPFELSLAFPTYASALAFRKSFYSTRSFLRILKQRRPQDYMPLHESYAGLERLSCARLDREPATKQLRELGSVYVTITLNTLFADLDQQLDHLGIPAIDPTYNMATSTNAEVLKAMTSPSATPSPSFSPSFPLFPLQSNLEIPQKTP
jgi:hypothetical protein